MPCVKKRGESDRACFERDDGIREVDNVITTRDLATLLRRKDIDPSKLEATNCPEAAQFVKKTYRAGWVLNG